VLALKGEALADSLAEMTWKPHENMSYFPLPYFFLLCLAPLVLSHQGSVDFAVSMDTRGFVGLPLPVVLPGITRDMMMAPSTSYSAGASSVSAAAAW
jgi:hypothetical protein